jgi:FMN reductase
MSRRIVSVIGNPRQESRTHGLARTMARELGRALDSAPAPEVDLARLGARVLVPDDEQAKSATHQVVTADVLVLASPTYKATYSGLIKAFLDRLGTGSLEGTAAVPILLGGAPDHRLAVDVHFTPLLLELGASVPARGLFVLESELESFGDFARDWADRHAPELVAVTAPPVSVAGEPAARR